MVAIQGTEGSFHYQAAQDYFGSGIDILECRSFDAVVKALLAGQAQTGVMAIENSIAGAILPNYARKAPTYAARPGWASYCIPIWGCRR